MLYTLRLIELAETCGVAHMWYGKTAF